MKKLDNEELVIYGVTVAFWAIAYFIQMARSGVSGEGGAAGYADLAVRDFGKFLAKREES